MSCPGRWDCLRRDIAGSVGPTEAAAPNQDGEGEDGESGKPEIA